MPDHSTPGSDRFHPDVGYPAIPMRLDRVPVQELEELLVEAWLVQVPKRLATDYLRALG